jgi:hypothetical protein
MHGAAAQHSAKLHPDKPLVVRAGLGRTFGSLAGFAALTFLSCGIYLLADAFAHPVDAQAAGLIAAASSIALAALLLFYLFKPQKAAGLRAQPASDDSASDGGDTLSSAPSVIVRRKHSRKDLAYQRAYVDRSRIRP